MNISKAQTIVLNTIVLFEVFYLFSSKSIYENVIGRMFSNRIMLGGISLVLLLQLFITYSPLMNSVLRTAPLEIIDWMIILLVSSTVFFVIEAEKLVYRKR
jgi:magnesium-transporting ATPase (P-type)